MIKFSRYHKFYWLELINTKAKDCEDRVCYIDPYGLTYTGRFPTLIPTREAARYCKRMVEKFLSNVYDLTRYKVVIVQVEHPCDKDIFAERVR